MYTVLVVAQVLIGIALIGLVLVQHGKGADAGAAFGSGASGTVFGARGSANFLSRSTAMLALLFFLTSLGLAWMVRNAPVETDSVVAPAVVEGETADNVELIEPAEEAVLEAIPEAPEEEGSSAEDAPEAPIEAPE